MIVDILVLRQMKAYFGKINNTPLRDIVFIENGEELEFSEELLNEFEFTGLSNVDFILSGYYSYYEPLREVRECIAGERELPTVEEFINRLKGETA